MPPLRHDILDGPRRRTAAAPLTMAAVRALAPLWQPGRTAVFVETQGIPRPEAPPRAFVDDVTAWPEIPATALEGVRAATASRYYRDLPTVRHSTEGGLTTLMRLAATWVPAGDMTARRYVHEELLSRDADDPDATWMRKTFTALHLTPQGRDRLRTGLAWYGLLDDAAPPVCREAARREAWIATLEEIRDSWSEAFLAQVAPHWHGPYHKEDLERRRYLCDQGDRLSATWSHLAGQALAQGRAPTTIPAPEVPPALAPYLGTQMALNGLVKLAQVELREYLHDHQNEEVTPWVRDTVRALAGIGGLMGRHQCAEACRALGLRWPEGLTPEQLQLPTFRR